MLTIRSGGERVKGERLLTRIIRRKGSLYFPDYDALVDRKSNVFAVVESEVGKWVVPAANLITDAGDTYYGQRGASEAVTNAFGVLVLGTAVGTGHPAKTSTFADITEIAASEKAHDTGYPTTSDSDADNGGTTGADVVTYLTSYTKADFSATGISHGCITNAVPGTSEPLLTLYAFASSFDKTADDTLKVFTNHEMNGV